MCVCVCVTQVQSLGWEDLLEREMAPHSSVLAWKIPWMEEPGRLQPMGSQRVRHDWATSLSHIHICSWFVHAQKDKLETFLSWGCYLWLKVTQYCTQRRSRIPFLGGGILSLLSKLERNDRKQEGNVYFHNFPKKEKLAFCEGTNTDRKMP